MPSTTKQADSIRRISTVSSAQIDKTAKLAVAEAMNTQNSDMATNTSTSETTSNSASDVLNGSRNESNTKASSSNTIRTRQGCCPCLLENLDATTSMLLQIYNEAQRNRNNTSQGNGITSRSSISKRSLRRRTKQSKKIKPRHKKRRRRQTERKPENNLRDNTVLSQLDVCCLCNVLPESDLSLLSLAAAGEGLHNRNVGGLIATHTQLQDNDKAVEGTAPRLPSQPVGNKPKQPKGTLVISYTVKVVIP